VSLARGKFQPRLARARLPAVSPEESCAFILAHTVRRPVDLVPEIELFTATEVTPLWQATEAWLAQKCLEPPFWAFPWAGGQALARQILDQPGLVRGKRTLDFATGSGLVAIAAALAGASVEAVDIDPLALAACAENARLHGLSIATRCADLVGLPLPGVEVLLAGDIFYDQAASARFLPWLRGLVRSGTRVLVGDPGRAYGPTEGVTVIGVHEVPTPLDLEQVPSKWTRVISLGG
jgi:predicted nicotinamide N-methyase